MNSVDKATETQFNNIQIRTGKTLDELFGLIRDSGLTKHGEIREMLKHDLSLGYGDANALAGAFLRSDGQGAVPAAKQRPTMSSLRSTRVQRRAAADPREADGGHRRAGAAR